MAINLEKKSDMNNLGKWVDMIKLAKSAYDRHYVYLKYLKAHAAVGELMTEILHIHPKMYGIGGSWAMIGYGMELPRKPHDVDVIVDSRLMMTIKHLVEITKGLKIDKKGSNSLYALITVNYKEHHIDILGINNPDFVIVPGLGGEIYQLDNLRHIAAVKADWARPKDKEDLKLIDEFLGSKAIDDLNKELDKQLEQTPAPVPVPEKKEEDDDLPF